MQNLCKCGCLRPCDGEYFQRHDKWKAFGRKSAVDYIVEDRGYKTPCWIWKLKINKFGYGHIKADGKSVPAHRYYYEKYVKPIPALIDGRRAEPDHLCRTRCCVNPEHIEIVDQRENIRRGNACVVARRCHAKTQESTIREISEGYTAGESQYELAKRFGVGQSQISRILRGTRWVGIAIPTQTRSPIRLAVDQVLEIRRRIIGGEKHRAVAAAFGIGQSQVSRISRGESWKGI